MTGVEVIKTVYETDCPYVIPIYVIIAVLVLILAKIGHDRNYFIFDRIATTIMFICLGLSVVICIVSGFIQKPTDEIRYQEVSVSDEVSLNEFYNKYEIIKKI